MMAAIAEGLNNIHHANAGSQQRTVDAETTPLRDPGLPVRDDVPEVAEVWRRSAGFVAHDLTADALARPPQLSDFEGRVSDSGEGRWIVAGRRHERARLIIASHERFESRGEGDFAKLPSAMRSEFGGHAEKKD
jgi:6-phosphogluconate dehydrogenase